MSLPDNFRFSQSSLQDYIDCPRRFELRYMEDVVWPAVESEPQVEFEQRMQWGADLHRLIQQHLSGIPAERLAAYATEEPLKGWWRAYLETGLRDVPKNRWPETTLSASLGRYRLIAKYDLLAIAAGQQAIIVDWKTSRPKSANWLEQRLQTRVYRHVLVRAGAHLNGGQSIDPDQVTMVYWFASAPDEPVRLPYSIEQFDADTTYLTSLLDEIHERPEFPKTDNDRHCQFCTYRSLCDRGVSAGPVDELDAVDSDDLQTFDIDLDQIGEIAF